MAADDQGSCPHLASPRTGRGLFGRFPGANGTREADDDGTMRPLTRGYDQRLPHDLPHDYAAALKAYDGGRIDGFDQSPAADRYAFTQLVGPSQLPNYWHWAQTFVLGDAFFASEQGPSFPNHLPDVGLRRAEERAGRRGRHRGRGPQDVTVLRLQDPARPTLGACIADVGDGKGCR
jgi:hypothetical protein